MKRLARVSAVAGALALMSATASGANMLFIVDSSNSMWGQLDGKPKMDTAKDVLSGLLEDMPEGTNVGLMAYGHRTKEDCADIELMAGVGSADTATLQAKVRGLVPQGKTPIAAALQQSAQAFDGRLEESNNVVLISDGIETCGGDPCKAAEALAARGVNTRVHVIGFDVSAAEREQLKCISELGKGQYFDAHNAEGLKQAVAQVKKVATAAPETPPPPPAAPAPEVVFQDEFNGSDLGESWSVLNPDPDAYIVEGGKLLMVASGQSGFRQANTPNLMQLTQPLPKGDWDIKVKLRAELKTGRDSFWFGLYKDEKNFLAGHFWTTNNYCSEIALDVVKNSNGDESKFQTHFDKAVGCSTFYADDYGPFVDELAGKDLLFTLSKRGRKLTASVQQVGQTDKEGKSVVYETEALTSLRLPGAFAMAVGQWEGRPGETLVYVDEVKVEAL